MADRTVRAIFEARTERAQKNIADFGKATQDTGKKVDGLTKDLKGLDGQKVEPDIDLQIDEAKKRLSDLTGDLADLKAMEASPEVDLQIEEAQAQIKDVRAEIKDLTSQKYEVRVDAQIKDAKKRVEEITRELGDLRTQEVTPEVEVEIKDAQKRLRDTKAELRELGAAKATVKVDADTSAAQSGLADLEGDAADSGVDAGDAAGAGLVAGIVGSLKSIPIAGAVVGIGAGIGVALLAGIQDGLKIEAGRDLFSARTGLDADTSARFGRAAGEAYSQAWGESVEANMETARLALEAGLIDENAVDAEVEQVIASLSGVAEIMQEDIPLAARAAGQLIKTGLVDNSEEAFDILVAGYQNGANASQDFLDTLIEYPTHFRDLGLSAEEATGLLIQGMEGGAFNADKVADALKELTIRVKDLNDEAAGEALKTLGLNHEDMARKFAQGGEVARDALGDLLSGLRGIEDPAERSRLAVALFGTQAEDMAGALGSLDLSKAAQEIGGLEGSAGAAGRALKTMSDNAATDIEEAKRNIEVAADGIKGALAAAFGDDISAAADWVAANREPIMQFFIDVINATIDTARAFTEFGANALEAVGGIASGMADVLQFVPGIDKDLVGSLRRVGEQATTSADAIRTNIPSSLDRVQNSVNEWAAPELMKARVHDATMAMSNDMDRFSAKVNASGGTVTINGNKMNAEQALDFLVANINAEDGTVTINGTRVPAERALDVLMGNVNSSSGTVDINGNQVPANQALSFVKKNINASDGTVTINGNRVPASRALSATKSAINSSSGTVTIGGQDSPARSEVARLMGYVGSRHSSVSVGANTAAAERAINNAARDRYTTLNVRVSGVNSAGGLLAGLHGGGTVPGLHGGGTVPGASPGYDNILWPLHSGGSVMTQPLEGGEFVVNSGDAAFWGPLLAWMNSGGRPPAGGGGSATAVAPAPIDYGALAQAMSGAVSGLKVVTNINGRDFHGVIQKTQNERRGR